MEACSAGALSVIEVLLARRADVNLQDSMGCTALMRVSYSGYDELIRMLVQNGADVSITDRDGKKAYDYYITKFHNAEIEELLNK